MESWNANLHSWKTVPLSSSIVFFAGVFCLFGALILVFSSANFQSQTAAEVFWTVVISGTFAIVWAYAGTTRRYWAFGVLAALQFSLNYLVKRYGPATHSLAGKLPELKHKLILDASVEVALMVAAYVLFLVFFGREGNSV